MLLRIVSKIGFPSIASKWFVLRSYFIWEVLYREHFLYNVKMFMNIVNLSRISYNIFQRKMLCKKSITPRACWSSIHWYYYLLHLFARLSPSWISISSDEAMQASWSTLSKQRDFLDFWNLSALYAIVSFPLWRSKTLAHSSLVLPPPLWSWPLQQVLCGRKPSCLFRA